MTSKIIIFDRDGTLVIDREYLADPKGLEFEAGAVEGLRLLRDHGYRFVVITNQSGVGRGLFPIENLHAMNQRLLCMVESIGARLEGIYYCPHAPDAGCDCRKPGQALMNRAAAELGFDPAATIVIGDRDSDVEFGRRAGARTIRVTKRALPAGAVEADLVVRDIEEAAHALLTERDSLP